MGLDMNFYAVEDTDIDELPESFYYMSKQNALHHFFMDKYSEEGNTEEFNYVPFDVTDYLDELFSVVKQKKLTPISGFFFGSQDPNDIHYSDIEDFLKEAFWLVKHNLRIIYIPWY